MALLDDILSGGNWMTGLAIGVGAVVVLPLAAPVLRPLAKTAIKGGILAYQSAAGLKASVISSSKLSPRPDRRPHQRRTRRHTGRAQRPRGGIRTEAKPTQRKPRSTRRAGSSRAGDRL